MPFTPSGSATHPASKPPGTPSSPDLSSAASSRPGAARPRKRPRPCPPARSRPTMRTSPESMPGQRLPPPRPPGGQDRPAHLLKRTVPELDLDYVKLTEADLDQTFDIYWAGNPGDHAAARDHRSPARDLLRQRGIEYMHIEDYTIRRWLRSRIEEGRLRKDTLPNAEKKRRAEPPARGRAVREIPPHPLRRPEALLARGWRNHHPDPRQDRRGVPAPRRGADRHGHGASRPAQCAREHPGQGLRVHLQRICGEPRAELRARRRRREVSPRLRTPSSPPAVAARSASASRRTRAISRRSAPSSRARRARGSGGSTTRRNARKSCPCSSMAMRRSRARAWSRRR